MKNESQIPEEDARWAGFGIAGAVLEERAAWLSEPRDLHGNSLRFFEVAGKLVQFARGDYSLASAAFFHALLGLERALRLHYGNEKNSLSELLTRAVDDGVIVDSLFGTVPPYTPEFAKLVRGIVGNEVHARPAILAKLLPELRNQYFHGIFLLAPDYLHLAIQVRQIADALKTKRLRVH